MAGEFLLPEDPVGCTHIMNNRVKYYVALQNLGNTKRFADSREKKRNLESTSGSTGRRASSRRGRGRRRRIRGDHESIGVAIVFIIVSEREETNVISAAAAAAAATPTTEYR